MLIISIYASTVIYIYIIYLLVFSFITGSCALREEGIWKENNKEFKMQITYPVQNTMEWSLVIKIIYSRLWTLTLLWGKNTNGAYFQCGLLLLFLFFFFSFFNSLHYLPNFPPLCYFLQIFAFVFFVVVLAVISFMEKLLWKTEMILF